jgi:hypothetical protein
MRVLARICCVAILASTTLSPLAARAGEGSGSPLFVRGQILAIDSGYLVFTTGDAVRLGSTQPPADARRGLLGRPVRIALDTSTHAVTAIELDPGAPKPGEIDASALPRDQVSVDPSTAQTRAVGGAGTEAGAVTVTIGVRVPDDTPPNDDVYLSTERTNFNAAELRMNRVDARRWTISLPLAAGTALHYMFTRGSYTTVERQRGGGIMTPRSLTAVPSAKTDDTVARWADTT